MNGDRDPTSERTVFLYDSSNRLTLNSDAKANPGKATVPSPPCEPPPKPPPPFTFEHEREKGVFRLEWSDGEVEVFRDNPTRYLVVEPDLDTGELNPKTTPARPTHLYPSPPPP